MNRIETAVFVFCLKFEGIWDFFNWTENLVIEVQIQLNLFQLIITIECNINLLNKDVRQISVSFDIHKAEKCISLVMEV